MANLEVQLPAVPAEVGEPGLSIVNAQYVQNAFSHANEVFTDPDASEREVSLARAVNALADAVHQIIAGLHVGRLTVENFPSDERGSA